jgi:glycosyltransferase involved in cell wall biosynthesis
MITKYNNLFYIIDFRDWGYKYYEGYFYNSLIFRIFQNHTIKNADYITSVSNILASKYRIYFKINNNKLLFLPNGYDNLISAKLEDGYKRQNDKTICISYTGSIHIEKRNPETLIKAISLVIKKLKNEKYDIKIKFIYAGKDNEIIERYFKKYGIINILEDRGFVTREESIKIQNSSDILILLSYTGKYNEIYGSIITGKVYEYLISSADILAIAQKNWEMKELIMKKGNSIVLENREIDIVDYLYKYIKNKLYVNKSDLNFIYHEEIKQYSYINIAKKLFVKIEEYYANKNKE